VGVAGYKVYNAVTNSVIATTTSSNTYYLLSSLISGNLYSYYVKAFDAAGNYSAASNTIRIDPGRGGNTTLGAGAPDVITSDPNVSITFTGVTAGGITSVTQQSTPTVGPPAGFNFNGKQLDISTTASYIAPIQVAIKYNPADITGSEANLRLFHFESGSWHDVTLYVDTANNVIVGQTNSLSPFILGSPAVATGENTLFKTVLGFVVLIIGISLLATASLRGL
jgi:hypothetical protein